MNENSIGSLIKNILNETAPTSLQRRLPPVGMIKNWPTLVGGFLSGKCRPICLENNGLLVLAVEGASVRQELTMWLPSIAEKLQACGFPVEKIKLIPARTPAPETTDDVEYQELTAEEEFELQAKVEKVQNPELQTALKKLLHCQLAAQKKTD